MNGGAEENTSTILSPRDRWIESLASKEETLKDDDQIKYVISNTN